MCDKNNLKLNKKTFTSAPVEMVYLSSYIFIMGDVVVKVNFIVKRRCIKRIIVFTILIL